MKNKHVNFKTMKNINHPVIFAMKANCDSATQRTLLLSIYLRTTRWPDIYNIMWPYLFIYAYSIASTSFVLKQDKHRLVTMTEKLFFFYKLTTNNDI